MTSSYATAPSLKSRLAVMAMTVVRLEAVASRLRAARQEQALPSGANTEFVFGRNEIALQHYHRYVAHFAHGADLSH